jgi:hypothetical protein
MRSLQRIAKEAVGFEEGVGPASAEDVVDRIWGEGGSGGGEDKREERVERWVRALGGRLAQKINSGDQKPKVTQVQAPSVEMDAEMVGELDGPSDWEGMTGDELEMSDLEVQEETAKRTRLREEGEDPDEQEEGGTTWKRPRLATPGPPSTRGWSTLSPELLDDRFSQLDDVGLGAGVVWGSNTSLDETIPEDPITPTHTGPPTPDSVSPHISQPLPFNLGRTGSPELFQSCVSVLDELSRSLDPSLLLADAFIYVAHRSAPRPSGLVPLSHRVFSQDALLAGLDWTGAKRKRRALGMCTPTNQASSAKRIHKGVVIVDHKRNDTQVVVDWARSLGTPIRLPQLSKHSGKTMLYVVAPRAKHIYDSNYSMEGLELDVLCVVLSRST